MNLIDDPVRARARYGRGDGPDTDPSGPPAEVAAVDRIPVSKEMPWLASPGRRFDHLAPDPGRGRVRDDVHVHQCPSAVGDEHQDIERLEGERDRTVSKSAAHTW